tara:strand:+ start:7899 stop:9170 length:1272 start_codon:yes stop_codon:yes gene_type:complete
MLRKILDYVSPHYFYNTLWLIGENLVRIGSGVVVIYYLARYLGPEDYGNLSYSQSFVSIGAAFSTLGIDVILVREIVAGRISESRLLGSACALRFFAALISILSICILASVLGSSDTELLIFIISISIVFDVSNTLDTYFQAKVLSKKSAIVKTLVTLASSVLKLSFVYNSASVVYFAWLLVIDSVMMVFGYYLIYVRSRKKFDGLVFDVATALYLLRRGWPLMLVTVSVLMYTKVDQIMIKHLMNGQSVGYYTVAVKLSTILNFIPLMIVQSIFPKIVNVKLKGSEMEYFSLLRFLYRVMMFVSIPIAILMFFCGGYIVDRLFGIQYEPAAGILRILSFTIILVSVGSVTTKIMYAENYEKKYLYRSLIGVAINVVLNWFLIPMWGGQGAALSTIITLFVLFYVFDLLDKDLRKYWLLKFLR